MSTTAILTAKQRISDFQKAVNRQQSKIRKLGAAAWSGIKATGEVEIVRTFLSSRSKGTGLLNRELVPLLSKNGWVVKFASVFLHQMPMVKGRQKDGALLSSRCELGDLQTIFLYLRADNTVLRARSVIFQAKMKPHGGSHVIDHAFQRQLYDDCPGYRYETVIPGEERTLPEGPEREKALQYLFVGEDPVRARTIPSVAGYGAFVDYGEHLLRFLNDSTGLEFNSDHNGPSYWNQIVWDMIDQVAKAVTRSGGVRNQGLRTILDHFNSFEEHDKFFVGPAEGSEGYGVQFVIVWDSRLDENQITDPMLPLDLLHQLADQYENTHYPDLRERVHRKDILSQRMAKLIIGHRIPFEEVVGNALKQKGNGLIAGLARAMEERSDGDHLKPLSQLLPCVTWKHTLFLVLRAIFKIFKEEKCKQDDVRETMRLLEIIEIEMDRDLLRLIRDIRAVAPKPYREPQTVKKVVRNLLRN